MRRCFLTIAGLAALAFIPIASTSNAKAADAPGAVPALYVADQDQSSGASVQLVRRWGGGRGWYGGGWGGGWGGGYGGGYGYYGRGWNRGYYGGYGYPGYYGYSSGYYAPYYNGGYYYQAPSYQYYW